MDLSGRFGGGQQQSDMKYILKVEPTGFPVGLDVGYEIKRGVEVDSKTLGRSNWVNVGAIH